MFVKICGITSEEDALAAAALGADAVGFIFAPSPRQMTPGRVNDIIKRLPPEILTVGVFRDEEPARVIDIGLKAGVKAIQLHGHETPSQATFIRPKFPVLIVAMSAGDSKLASFDRFGADALMLDAPSPGSGQVFDWALAEGMPTNRRVILAGGLTPENVAAGIDQVRPWGVDASTGLESAPGVKDPMLVHEFIRNARAAASGDDDQPPPLSWGQPAW